MANLVDDAFASADDAEVGRKRAEEIIKKQTAIFAAEIDSLVSSLLDAVRVLVENFNGNKLNTNPATIQQERWKISIRRAAATGMLDRYLQVAYEPPAGHVVWAYQVLPHPAAQIEPVESGNLGFAIGEDDHLHFADGYSVEGLANEILRTFIKESVDDMVKARNRRP